MDDVERLWGAKTPEEEERYKKIIDDRVRNSPFYMLIGMEVVGLAPGEARLRIKTGPQLHDDDGLVHPGVIFGLADASSGVAMATMVPRGSRRIVTVEMKANFMAPVKGGELTGIGKVLERDEELAVSEAEVFDGEGNLVARSMATFMMLQR
jgi:uncharacterized protein (TIGR00369 family)